MTDQHNPKDVENRLWKEIERGRYGMLGLVGVEHPQHFQPMTAFPESENGQIWFFTRDDTDLAKAVTAAEAPHAMLTISSKDQEVQACLGGTLALSQDRERIEKFWSPVVAAWYPDGKDDPHLTLLRMDLEDAAVWLSEAGPVRFAFEIARANLTGRKPDLGGRAEVKFN
jgi:general stress protein 26